MTTKKTVTMAPGHDEVPPRELYSIFRVEPSTPWLRGVLTVLRRKEEDYAYLQNNLRHQAHEVAAIANRVSMIQEIRAELLDLVDRAHNPPKPPKSGAPV